eukprot:gene958-2590_t
MCLRTSGTRARNPHQGKHPTARPAGSADSSVSPRFRWARSFQFRRARPSPAFPLDVPGRPPHRAAATLRRALRRYRGTVQRWPGPAEPDHVPARLLPALFGQPATRQTQHSLLQHFRRGTAAAALPPPPPPSTARLYAEAVVEHLAPQMETPGLSRSGKIIMASTCLSYLADLASALDRVYGVSIWSQKPFKDFQKGLERASRGGVETDAGVSPSPRAPRGGAEWYRGRLCHKPAGGALSRGEPHETSARVWGGRADRHRSNLNELD